MEIDLLCAKLPCKNKATNPMVAGGLPTFCDEHFLGIVAEPEELTEAVTLYAANVLDNDLSAVDLPPEEGTDG